MTAGVQPDTMTFSSLIATTRDGTDTSVERAFKVGIPSMAVLRLISWDTSAAATAPSHSGVRCTLISTVVSRNMAWRYYGEYHRVSRFTLPKSTSSPRG